MTRWREISFQPAQARVELQELDTLLKAESQLSEEAICSFIRQRTQLIASLGLLNSGVDTIDRWAPELDLLGKHLCDIVVGDSRRTAYTLIELEDATADRARRRVFA